MGEVSGPGLWDSMPVPGILFMQQLQVSRLTESATWRRIKEFACMLLQYMHIAKDLMQKVKLGYQSNWNG